MKPTAVNIIPKLSPMQHTFSTKDVAEMLFMQEVNVAENTEKLVDFFVPRFLNSALGLDLNAPEEQTFDLVLKKIYEYMEYEPYSHVLKSANEKLQAKKRELNLDQNTHDGFIYAIGMKNHLKVSATGALMSSEIMAGSSVDVIEEEKLYRELKEKTFNWLRAMNTHTLPNISDKDLLDFLLAAATASSICQVHGEIA